MLSCSQDSPRVLFFGLKFKISSRSRSRLFLHVSGCVIIWEKGSKQVTRQVAHHCEPTAYKEKFKFIAHSGFLFNAEVLLTTVLVYTGNC